MNIFRRVKRRVLFGDLYGFLKQKRFARVLEVGAGSLEESWKGIINCEEYIVSDAKAKPINGMVWIDARSIPFPSNYFDLVVCNAVLEHMWEAQSLCRAISELKRVCMPGGLIAVVVPFIYPEHDSVDSFRFTLAGLKRCFGLPVVFDAKAGKLGRAYSNSVAVFQKPVEDLDGEWRASHKKKYNWKELGKRAGKD